MIYRPKIQGKTPLDYHYTNIHLIFLKNEGQEGKMNLFCGWIPVGERWAQGKGE
jgi:hypothetical protein